MHCRTCDYPLWNLPGRECPECGSPFTPSDFQFKPGAVKYCCPDCDQEYYGTSPQGHLIPRSFTCVGCSRQVDMDEMKLIPAEGWEDSTASRLETPWLRPNEGFIKRWFGTVGWSYVKPIDLMRGVPTGTGTGSAWWFMILTQIVAGLLGIGLPLLVIGIIVAITSSGRGGAVGLGFLGFSGLSSVGSILVTILYAVIWAALAHGTLRITGGCAHSIGRTMSAVFYASGTMAIQAVPCIGPYCFSYVVMVWWLISAVLMVAEGQKVSGARASLAVLWFPIGTVLAFVGLYIGFIVLAVAGAPMGTIQIPVQPVMVTQSEAVFAEDMRAMAAATGTWPGSPIDVLAVPGFSQSDRHDFLSKVTGGNSVGVDVIPGWDVIDLGMLDGPSFRRRLEQVRASEVPPVGVVQGGRDFARLGALVYCTPGQPFSRSGRTDKDLWILVLVRGEWNNWNDMNDRNDVLWFDVYFADGTWSAPMDWNEFSTLLEAQDALRRELDLAPISDAVDDAVTYVESLPGR